MTVHANPHRNAQHSANDTWLEPEELCYPGGGMHRRCRAIFPDGKARVVKAGIPDATFSIPAKHSAFGSGFIDHEEGKGFLFHPKKAKMPRENIAIARVASALMERAKTGPAGRHLRWFQKGYSWGDEHQDEPDESEEEKDEGHHPCEPEKDSDKSAVDIAVQHLKDAGIQHASSSHFHRGMWYSTEPEKDTHTGIHRERSYHPTGFSHAEEREIAQRMSHTGVKVV